MGFLLSFIGIATLSFDCDGSILVKLTRGRVVVLKIERIWPPFKVFSNDQQGFLHIPTRCTLKLQS
jgi:hypothetical protein